MNLSNKWAAALACLVWVGTAQAGPLDAKSSSIKATFSQFNVPVTGEFKQFAGDVSFDPAKPEATKASLTVQTASYDLGDAQYNKEVAGKDWFDSKKHPSSSLTITSVKPAPGGSYTAVGELNLRGVKKSLQFPVKISSKGSTNTFTGQARVKRLDFGVGADGDWGDETLVANEVVIDFRLTTVGK